VTLSSGLTFDLDGQHYALDGLKATLNGDAAGFQGLDLQAAGNLDADLKNTLFKLAKLKLTLKGKTGANALEATLEAPRLDVSATRAEGEKVTLDARVTRPDGHLDAKLAMPGVSGNAKDLRIGALSVTLDGQQGESRIKGVVSSPVNGNLQALRFDFPRLAANLTVENPSFPGGKLAASLGGNGSLDLAKSAFATNLAGQLDTSRIQANLALTRFSPPALRFDLGVDQLDVDRYLAAGKDKGKGASDKPFDFSVLKSLDASGSVRVGALQVAGVKASNVRLDVKAAGGEVRVSPLGANLYQGTLAGSVVLDARASEPRFAIAQKLSNISVGPLLRDAAKKDLLEGRGDITLDVTTRGASVPAMERALSGSAALHLRDGAIKGINLAQTLRNAKSKLTTLRGQQSVTANSAEKTDFTELAASFSIRDGIAHNQDLALKSPLLRIGGNGDVNIPASSLDYLVKTTVVGSLQGQGGQDASGLKGVTIPVRVSGPFDKLAYTLDFSAMVSEQAKQKVEEKKEAVKGKARDEVKKGLQGIFRH
jgi:AsmA protein